jgi:hypothetical protein
VGADAISVGMASGAELLEESIRNLSGLLDQLLPRFDLCAAKIEKDVFSGLFADDLERRGRFSVEAHTLGLLALQGATLTVDAYPEGSDSDLDTAEEHQDDKWISVSSGVVDQAVPGELSWVKVDRQSCLSQGRQLESLIRSRLGKDEIITISLASDSGQFGFTLDVGLLKEISESARYLVFDLLPPPS